MTANATSERATLETSIVEAVNQQTGERFVVRSEHIDDAVIELAEQVGIELRDS